MQGHSDQTQISNHLCKKSEFLAMSFDDMAILAQRSSVGETHVIVSSLSQKFLHTLLTADRKALLKPLIMRLDEIPMLL